MSFVQLLDSQEFPALNLANQMAKIQIPLQDSSSSGNIINKHQERFAKFLKLKPDERREKLNKPQQIDLSKEFVKCRTGLRMKDYHQDLNGLLNAHQIGEYGDFINVFIKPIRSDIQENELELIPDLVLPFEQWTTRICLEIIFSPIANLTPNALRRFEQIFLHALYLPALVIVITSPNSEQSHASIAAIINQSMLKIKKDVLILFRVHVAADTAVSGTLDLGLEDGDIESDSSNRDNINDHYNDEHDYESELTPQDKSPVKECLKSKWLAANNYNDLSTSTSSGTRWTTSSPSKGWPYESPTRYPVVKSWQKWCSISSHLADDPRFGVCLDIDQDLPDNEEELNRWTGAPVHMIAVNVNRFYRRSFKAPLTMEFHCRKFIKKLVIANSLKVSIVLDGYIKEDVREYLTYLDYLTHKFRTRGEDRFLCWNDRIQEPLQPLSSNLDSSTYGVFEMDSTKYIKYREAMVAALIKKKLDLREQKSTRLIILMVLGAGRGPLVDCFIDAIKSVDSEFKYKIYALDKNYSSVRSLKYKLHNNWQDKTGLYEVEVIESDMRSWEPNEKADIIATELLGSFSDNELSPECIDGTWRFSTPETISIPQEYSSYLAPIYSCKFRQELHKHKLSEADVYDKIYVDRLANYYMISEPQELFNFEHKELHTPPKEGQNERYKTLTFVPKVNTTCHGFVGYFRAHLFGNVEISTLFGHETPEMRSWFPAAIPLEHPVDLPIGTKLVVHFWRKDSHNSVWYQWAVTHPQRSRPHSGEKTAMSKFV